jgi:hypothetical protein
VARKLKKQYALAYTANSIKPEDLYSTLSDALANAGTKPEPENGLYPSRQEAIDAYYKPEHQSKWCVLWDGKNLSTATFTKIGK